jgi:hypothetical protein
LSLAFSLLLATARGNSHLPEDDAAAVCLALNRLNCTAQVRQAIWRALTTVERELVLAQSARLCAMSPEGRMAYVFGEGARR